MYTTPMCPKANSPMWPGYNAKLSAFYDKPASQPTHALEQKGNVHGMLTRSGSRMQAQLQSMCPGAVHEDPPVHPKLPTMSFEGESDIDLMADCSHPLDAAFRNEAQEARELWRQFGVNTSVAYIEPDDRHADFTIKSLGFKGWGTIDCVGMAYETLHGERNSIMNFASNCPELNGAQGRRAFDAHDLRLFSLLLQKSNLPQKPEELAMHAAIPMEELHDRLEMNAKLCNLLGLKNIIGANNGRFGLMSFYISYS